MACDRCDECLEQGMKFCAYCGDDLREDCEHCEEYRRSGARYCSACGKKLVCGMPKEHIPEKEGFNTVLKNILAILVPLISIVLIVEAGYMVAGTLDVLDWAETHTVNLLGLVPHLVVLTTMSGTVLQIAWVLIEIAIIASLAILAVQTWRESKSGEGTLPERIRRTPLYTVGLMFGTMIALNLIINLVGMMFGAGVKVPEDMELGSTAAALFQYADAAVWEEVISRLVPVGIPMMVAGILCKRKDSWKFLLGGFGMSRLAIVLIIISSVMFGFAHMSGWGWEKVLPSFASGLLLGYLYVKVGIHASIAMHFLTDYMAVVIYGGLMVPMTLIYLAIVLLGFVCLISVLLDMRKVPDAVKDMPNWVPPAQESIFSKRD